MIKSATVDIPEAFANFFVEGCDKVFWGGREGAKSTNAARAALIRGAQKKLRVVCAREIQDTIDQSIYQLLVDQIEAMGLGDMYEVLRNEIRGRNGTQFKFKGLKHNPEGIKSFEGIDILIVEEANTVSQRSWDSVIPTIRKEGSEIWVIFNPVTSDDPTYQIFVEHPMPGTIVRKVSYRDNPFLTERSRLRIAHLKTTDPEAYDFIYEGNFNNRVIGAYFAELINKAESEGRICNVPYEPALPVYTASDLGMNDEFPTWFFQVYANGKEMRAIDYHAASDHGLDYYAREFKNRQYVYEAHYMPHDINVRELGTGVTRKATMEALGIKPVVVVPRVANNAEGREAVRAFLPRVWFDKTRCADGIKALRSYHREWDDKRQVFKEDAQHDWASHPTKAFETFVRGWKPKNIISARRDNRPATANGWMG